MARLRVVALFEALCGFAALCGCRASGRQKTDAPPIEAAAAVVHDPPPVEAEAAPTPDFLDDGAGRVFKGTLGKGLRVVMRLDRAAQVVRGRYFYESKGIDIDIEGTVSPDGAVALDEAAAPSKKSGHFAGTIDDQGNFTGTWTDGKGRRTLPFRLSFSPPAWTAGSPVPLYKKRVHLAKKAKMKDPSGLLKTCTLDAEYPEIDGALDPLLEMKLNGALRPKSTVLELVCDAPETNDVKYNVSLNQSGVVSVVFETEWCCGAHPSYGREFVNLSVGTGERLTLARLLSPDARPKLVGFLLPAVQATAHEIELDKTTEVLKQLTEKPAEFSIEPGGLRFSAYNSQPHVIQAAFADGFFLPFSRIASLLRDPGPLDGLLRD